jgi:hypothetical protein
MSSLYGQEEVIRVPPLSTSDIERVAEALLAELCPEALESPTKLDLLDWVDHQLGRLGIFVAPVAASDLVDAAAVTIPDRSTGIEILMAEELWDALLAGGVRSYFARSTLAHELGHAVLHVSTIRRRKASPLGQHLLHRVVRRELKPYEDPEWQAWTFAGFLMAPRRTVAMLRDKTSSGLSAAFGMNTPMADVHLRRLAK